MTLPGRSRRVALGAMLWAATALAAGQGAVDLEAAGRDKERIGAERERVERVHAGQLRECGGRFLVTACVDAADRERREALQRLRARELEIDEATRRARAAARLADIEARRLEQAGRGGSKDRGTAEPSRPGAGDGPPPRSPSLRMPRAVAPSPLPAPARPPREPKARAAPAPSESSTDRAVREARSRERYAERQQAAAASREAKRLEAEQRRLAGKPVAAPLPVPSAPPR